ncbi:MAG: hypothetical protein NVSMB38_02150 [Ktedonobacteraceae bacterium]
MLAEELHVLDANSLLWQAIRSLLTIAMRLEQDDTYMWHGWNKEQITTFLKQLPMHCTLLAGVWATDENEQQQERVVFGCVCEVVNGEVQSVRTFEALTGGELPPLQELEPGFEHALEIMRVVRQSIAPVAWALFTDKATWDEWVYTGDERVIDKGELLAAFARQGRCVLMGSQTQHHHP